MERRPTRVLSRVLLAVHVSASSHGRFKCDWALQLRNVCAFWSTARGSCCGFCLLGHVKYQRWGMAWKCSGLRENISLFVYVCVYVCMYVGGWYIFNIYIYIYILMYVDTWIYKCKHELMYLCMRVNVYINVNKSIEKLAWKCSSAKMRVFLHTYT
jgi:hypothetical protein